VEVNQENRVIGFIEKKYCQSGLINGGIYLINKELFNMQLKDRFSFEKDVMEAEISRLSIYGHIQDSYFIDIGIPADYEKANVDFLNFD
jgi:D-glycero-alpha-D-manno-heptose 1-phosphate guanylyltransferase